MSLKFELTEAGKEELALALIVWKDFKCQGKFDADISVQMFKFAEILGISEELNSMITKVPPLIVKPRYD